MRWHVELEVTDINPTHKTEEQFRDALEMAIGWHYSLRGLKLKKVERVHGFDGCESTSHPSHTPWTFEVTVIPKEHRL